jgi:hypothetical protein
MPLKLGKLDPRPHPATLDFARYLTGELPEPAHKVWREYAVPASAKQMYGNSDYSDCVWAMCANALILTSVHTGPIVVPTLQEVLAGYSAVTGFDPLTGANDDGTAMTDALAYWKDVGIGGHKILAWAQIDHTNLVHRKLGVDLFGMTLVGVQLPASAQEQFAAGQPWEYIPDSPIEGGHAILRCGYGAAGSDYESWAKWDQKASNDWEANCIDEEYVIITPQFINQATQRTPGGLDLATLQADLAAMKV